MKRILLILSMSCFVATLFAQTTAVMPTNGTGTESEPYEIENLANLRWLSETASVWDNHFVQTADIDAAETANWNEGEGFSPIGIDDENSFTGNYNGNFHKISNLYINRPNVDYQGLFGMCKGTYQDGYNTSTSNLILENVDITGKDYVGGIAGYGGREIEKTSVSGSVKGNRYVGGITGSAYYLTESFSEGYIEGNIGVGGISGDARSGYTSIQNSYSRATISGRESVGGIIGEGPDCEPDWGSAGQVYYNFFAGIIENATPEHSGAIFGSYSTEAQEYLTGFNFWDKDLNGIDWGTTRSTYYFTTAEMKNTLTYLSGYWDMLSIRTNAIWDINSEINDEYPYLIWTHTSETQDAIAPLVGNGSEESPFEIENIANLRWLYENEEVWDKYFIQTADIDAKEAKYWEKRNRIGTSQTNFTGSYNGNFNIIDNLTIELFGVIDNATIEKVVVTNALYANYDSAGGIVDYAKNSKISQTSFSGIIYSSYNLGGICGNNNNSIIEESFSDGAIYGKHDCIGGIVGRNYDGIVKNNYSTSSLSGSKYDQVWSVGGIVGCHESESAIIEYNYFAGNFENRVNNAGGIIAHIYSNAYPAVDKGNLWDTDISQVTDNLGNGIGLSSNEMKDLDTYTNAMWLLKYPNAENPAWNIGNGKNNGYPYLNWQYPDDDYIDIPQYAFVDFVEINLIGRNTVEGQLNVIYIGNPVATEFGICYTIGGTPTTSDETVTISSAINIGQFAFEITDLEEGEVYSFRAYAINEVGTSYGKEIVKTILYSQVPEGDGTEAAPYLISNFNELYWMSENSDSWDKYFLQTADIDASFSQTVLSEQGGLNPIGNESDMFTGSYNGNYKTISNLTINRPNRDRVGLFGFIDNATIEKFQLKNVNIQGDYIVGGIVGYSNRNSVISQTSVQGIVTGTSEVGGICGNAYYALIEESFSDAIINATYMFAYSGGIVGYNYGSTIINNYSISENSGFNSGGIIGSNRWYNEGIVENNYFAGTFGWGSTNKGGIIGGGEIPKIDKGNFWDTEISEVAETIGNGEAKATEDMTELATFVNAGWNMKLLNSTNYGVWNIGNGKNNGYPYLRWQYPEDEGIDMESTAKISIDEITVITEISANVILNIDYVGNPIATEFGICYSENDIPTTDDNKQDFSNVAEGKYEFVLDNLEENAGYYFRAYIINDKGISYSDVVAKITVVVDEPKGEGTEENPYRISNFSELLWISENSDSWDKHFVQTDDIDASLSKFLNKGKGFSPIGNRDLDIYFTGTYSGGYHKIDNLFINRPEESCQGLFGAINEGYIEKLYLNNVNITGGAYVGGLVGFMYSSASLYQVSVSGVVNGVDNVGGIIGYNSGLIEQSYFVGDVSGIYSVGGITGFNMRGEIINCYSISNLIGEEDSPIGGIIGLNYSFYSTVVNNFFVGTIDSETTRKGGIIGADNVANTSSGNFWDYDVSNLLENIGEGEAISTAEMKTINTFVNAGWEFVGLGGDEIWDIDSEINDGYPYLAWILNEKEDIGVGVIDNSVNNSTISIHPNPFTNVVNITGNGITRVKVYTTSGVQILDTKYNSESEITIQTSDFGQGIYLFVVEDGGNVETYKLIKR